MQVLGKRVGQAAGIPLPILASRQTVHRVPRHLPVVKPGIEAFPRVARMNNGVAVNAASSHSHTEEDGSSSLVPPTLRVYYMRRSRDYAVGRDSGWGLLIWQGSG